VHTTGHVGDGHPVPSQVRHGQDGRVRFVHAAAAGSVRERGVRTGLVSHAGVGFPD